MVKRLTLTGSTLRPQSIANKGRMAQGLKEKVWPLLEAGKIKPIIYKTFPLKDAAGAHAELERADHVGKVMLTVYVWGARRSSAALRRPMTRTDAALSAQCRFGLVRGRADRRRAGSTGPSTAGGVCTSSSADVSGIGSPSAAARAVAFFGRRPRGRPCGAPCRRRR